METVRVNLGPRSYDIALATADPTGLGPFARLKAPRAESALVVTDAHVEPHAVAVVHSLRQSGVRAAPTPPAAPQRCPSP